MSPSKVLRLPARLTCLVLWPLPLWRLTLRTCSLLWPLAFQAGLPWEPPRLLLLSPPHQWQGRALGPGPWLHRGAPGAVCGPCGWKDPVQLLCQAANAGRSHVGGLGRQITRGGKLRSVALGPSYQAKHENVWRWEKVGAGFHHPPPPPRPPSSHLGKIHLAAPMAQGTQSAPCAGVTPG